MFRKLLRGTILSLILAALLAITASAVTIGGATVSGSSVRLRSSADTSSSANIIKQMNKGTFLLVEEKLSGWYKVVCDGVEGYVSADYAAFSETLDGTYTFSAATTGTNVNMRAGATTNSAAVKRLPAKGTALTVTGVSGQWLKVKDALGAAGYIRSDYVSYSGGVGTPQTEGSQLVETAKSYLGYSYRWGGMSPKTGFDCSGLVNYVYEQYGYDLDRTAQQIYSNNGTAVTKESLQPGDVLCFGWGPRSITHVGIYIGDGQMVHASTSTTGVITKIDIVYGTGADDNDEYHVFVKYSVDGTEYEEELGEYSAGMHEGDDVDLLYNPDNPRQLQKAGLTSIIIAFVFSGLSILVAVIMFLRFLR